MTEEIDELSDEDWAKLLASKRHNQISDMIMKVLTNISSNKEDYLSSGNELLQKLDEIKNIDPPEIRIDNNNEELISLLKQFNQGANKINEDQGTIIELLKNKPSQMKVVRGMNGTISHIDIKYPE